MHYHLSRHPAGGCGTHKAGLLQMGWGLRNVRQRQRVNKAWFPPGFAGTFAGTFVLVLFPFWLICALLALIGSFREATYVAEKSG